MLYFVYLETRYTIEINVGYVEIMNQGEGYKSHVLGSIIHIIDYEASDQKGWKSSSDALDDDSEEEILEWVPGLIYTHIQN